MTASTIFSTAAGSKSAVVEASSTDARGNVLASIQSDGSTVSFDATAGDLVSAISGAGGTVTNLFDGYGNLTNDGVRVYGWDAEMRLVSVEPTTVAEGASRLTYSYDPHSRRDTRERYIYESGTWRHAEHIDFMYAGWLLLAERIQTIDSGSTSTSYRAYAWGPDFGDTMQAASPMPSDAIGSMGGIGGLLSVTVAGVGNPATYYYHSDLSGNIVALTDETGLNVVARYDYTEKGSIANTSDADFTINPFTWRGKYQEPETGGLLYFGYRHYSPFLARWISRDPIGKAGGINENAYYDPDPLGLYDEDVHMGLTHFLAVKAGFCEADAIKLAMAAQSVDVNPVTSPLPAWLLGEGAAAGRRMPGGKTPTEELSERMVMHFPTPDPRDESQVTKPNSAFAQYLINSELDCSKPDLASYGRMLHSYKDSWSHRGWKTGHAMVYVKLGISIGQWNTSQDDTSRKENFSFDMDMAENVYNKLRVAYVVMKVKGSLTGEGSVTDWSAIRKDVEDYLQNTKTKEAKAKFLTSRGLSGYTRVVPTFRYVPAQGTYDQGLWVQNGTKMIDAFPEYNKSKNVYSWGAKLWAEKRASF